ncbi:unnamed protein product [Cyprideis torosa]|uniref:Uncharacterized protein n=1 Tax=Cyprideis torosa TaxID=163714 RepID=A0A7R8W0Z1_9CRUS|nr:unnamed protein product [Cyprideis torosa]CAG0880133.1 unnamed protein product [Cyprideis torosa]
MFNMPTESDYKRMVLTVLKEADKDGSGVTYAEIQAALGKTYGLQGTVLGLQETEFVEFEVFHKHLEFLEDLQKALKELLDASKIVSFENRRVFDATKFKLPADDEKFENAESKLPGNKEGNLENGSHSESRNSEPLVEKKASTFEHHFETSAEKSGTAAPSNTWNLWALFLKVLFCGCRK